MPLRTLIPICAATTLAWVFSIRAHATEDSAAIVPTLTIEEALDIAKRCVLDRNVQLVGSLIESARFERNPRGDRGPYWVITWAYAREVKGGQLFVSVFQSRTCELKYGE
jgi:hypothetical protein